MFSRDVVCDKNLKEFIMSKWTSKNAILRDLSEAQGCGVPVDIVDVVADGEKPPTPNFVEETEEEYFQNCTGAGDALSLPDFGLIRQMLNVVQLSNTSDNEDEEKGLNNVLPLQMSIIKEVNNKEHGNKKMNTKRLGRNVAVESILQAIGKEIINDNQVKKDSILKTEDCRVLNDNISQKTLINVNSNYGNSRQNSPANNRPLALEPVNMFRKKSPSKNVVNKVEAKPFVEKNNTAETYKPSELANEYYKKYVERMRLREAMQDDIWTKAEKKMKEIEAMKILQASQSAQSSSNEHETEVGKIWEEINLPQHRHLLSEDCVVCSMLSMRGYHIEETE